ncbi:unnamed protein product [Leuciscus chuanchicus]
MPTISMKHSGSDSTVVKDIKAAIAHDFEDRHPDTDWALIQFLHMSTALDPRFKSLPFLDETTHDTIFKSLHRLFRGHCHNTESKPLTRQCGLTPQMVFGLLHLWV